MALIYGFVLLSVGIFNLIQLRKKLRTITIVELIKKGDKNLLGSCLICYLFIVVMLLGPYKISNQKSDFIGNWKSSTYELKISESGTCIYSQNNSTLT